MCELHIWVGYEFLNILVYQMQFSKLPFKRYEFYHFISNSAIFAFFWNFGIDYNLFAPGLC